MEQAIRTTQNMSPAGTTHYLHDRAGRLLVEADNTGQTLRKYVSLDELPLTAAQMERAVRAARRRKTRQ